MIADETRNIEPWERRVLFDLQSLQDQSGPISTLSSELYRLTAERNSAKESGTSNSLVAGNSPSLQKNGKINKSLSLFAALDHRRVRGQDHTDVLP